MFRERLEPILSALDARATVALIGADGLVVESLQAPDRGGPELDLDMLAAELVALCSSISENHREFGGRLLHGLSLVTGGMHVAIFRIDDLSFLLAATDSDASLGRLRFELRRAPLRLAGALA